MEERVDGADRSRCSLSMKQMDSSPTSMEPPAFEPADPKRGFSAPGTALMVAGGLAGAVGAYLFQLVGSRSVGSEEFAPIGVLWTLLFIVGTVLLIPLEQFVTRQVSLGRWSLRANALTGWGVIGLSVVIGAGFVLATLSPLFSDKSVFLFQTVLLFAGHGVMFFIRGYLAGCRRFAAVGWLLLSESLLRLVAAVVFLSWSSSAVSLGWAMVVAPLALLTMPIWSRTDHSLPSGVSEPRSAARFLGSYSAGSAAAQVLLGGAPLAVAALGAGPSAVSIVFVTFTLFRGPLTLIYSLQGRLLPMLVRLGVSSAPGHMVRLNRRIVQVGTLFTLMGGLLGWLVGPWVVELLFSNEFRPTREVTALAAGGMAAAAAAQIGGQILVATGRTGRLALVWTVGLLVSLLLLPLLPGQDSQLVVSVSFAMGAVTVLAGLGMAGRRPHKVAGEIENSP